MTLPKLRYPWFAYAGGKAVMCSKCRQWISDDEPRAWCAKDRSCMHLDCHGAYEMNDKTSMSDPARPVAAPEASPERDVVGDRIERMHAEKMAVLERIAKALEAMKP